MARVIITWDDEVPSLQYSDTVGSQQWANQRVKSAVLRFFLQDQARLRETLNTNTATVMQSAVWLYDCIVVNSNS